MVVKAEALSHPLPALPEGCSFTSEVYKDAAAKFASYANGPKPVRLAH